MEKTRAVASIGEGSLLMPARIKAALRANDRLKVYLSLLQSAADHAAHPDGEPLDLGRELTIAGLDALWLRELPGTASLLDGTLLLPQFERLVERMAADLETMARPLFDAPGDKPALQERVRIWLQRLEALRADRLDETQLAALTRGHRSRGDDDIDSLHLFVMDLHRQINRLALALSTDQIDGAHVWQLLPEDRTRVAAFMRGLNRTAPLKFDHPGLDTAATRDGDRLLLQNDIGTNDAHVLVVQIRGTTIGISYADLHRARFEFFQTLLAPYGAQWGSPQARVDAELNAGDAYTFGTAEFDCANDTALDATLEGIASRIVFLIDWNRARKRLLPFASKRGAIEVLQECARLDVGHVAWLKAGGEQLIYAAMQANADMFRIGDRLDEVLGAAETNAFLVDVMRLASHALRAGRPVAFVADETRLVLARRVQQRSTAFDLLGEHAAYCHALAQAVADALVHDATSGGAGVLAGDETGRAMSALAARAKSWERQADHLVMRARDQAQRQSRWQPVARLLEQSDDVADALEEAAFLLNLIGAGHRVGWTGDVRLALSQLAQAVLLATQEYTKAIAIARNLDAASDSGDGEAFLTASWNVLRSERQCDELLRTARRAILDAVHDARALMLANDLAVTLELASDRLLVAGYALRDLAFDRAGAHA